MLLLFGKLGRLVKICISVIATFGSNPPRRIGSPISPRTRSAARTTDTSTFSASKSAGWTLVLRPLVRKNLAALGATLGLRPFDTSLVIAIVQDRARVGESDAGDGRLAIVPPAPSRTRGPRSERRTMVLTVCAAAALAVAFFATLVRWVTRT